nr:uncharacterized protein LOC128697635 [Cherax quadricarinatus]
MITSEFASGSVSDSGRKDVSLFRHFSTNSGDSGKFLNSNGLVGSLNAVSGAAEPSSNPGLSIITNPIKGVLASGPVNPIGGKNALDSLFSSVGNRVGGFVDSSDRIVDFTTRGMLNSTLSASGSESDAALAAGATVNPVNNEFSVGSGTSFGGKGASIDSGFSIYNSPRGFVDANVLAGSLDGPSSLAHGPSATPVVSDTANLIKNSSSSGSLGSYDSSYDFFGSYLGVKNDATGDIFDSSNNRFGSTGNSSSVNTFGSFFGAPGSGTFFNPGGSGTVNSNKDGFASSSVNSGRKDASFDRSLGVNGGGPGGFSDFSGDFSGSFGRFNRTSSSGSFSNSDAHGSINTFKSFLASDSISSFSTKNASFDSYSSVNSDGSSNLRNSNGLVGSMDALSGPAGGPFANAGISNTVNMIKNGLANIPINSFDQKHDYLDSSISVNGGGIGDFVNLSDRVGSFGSKSESDYSFAASVNPGVNGGINPVRNEFDNGSVSSFEAKNPYLENPLGLKSGSSSGFINSDGLAGSLDSFPDTVGYFANSLVVPGSGSFPNQSESETTNPVTKGLAISSSSSAGKDVSFASPFGIKNTLSDDFADSNYFAGSLNGFSGSEGNFGSAFDASASGSFADPGVRGTDNDLKNEFSSGVVNAYGGKGTSEGLYSVTGGGSSELVTLLAALLATLAL